MNNSGKNIRVSMLKNGSSSELFRKINLQTSETKI